MAKSYEVLSMLIPNGGWATYGDNFEDIIFIACEPITKEQFLTGLSNYDAFAAKKELDKTNEKNALLAKLGITAEEARLLLS